MIDDSKPSRRGYTTLAQLNDLVLSEAGVYQQAEVAPFNYSDGQETENILNKILRNAQDLSSCSSELEAQIIDWPTEYHLSQTRSNLLRPLNLTGVKKVLELGCGCGSITRYLGEHSSLEVDAVEGSLARAQLAAMRCRDLDNTFIHVGNFNELEFSDESYDLVLFIGVAEYAGRFSNGKSDHAALQDLLSLAKKVLKPDGVAVIAIENRLGLKYLLGAYEDHYGQPWVGVNDYQDSSGIRTYSRAQWREQIKRSPFTYSHFAYPFPDYKVPTLVVNEIGPEKLNNLDEFKTIHSRDYVQPFIASTDEARLWSGVVQANALGEFANSFLISLSNIQGRLEQLNDFNIRRYAGPRYDWHEASLDVPNGNLASVVESQRISLRDLQQQLAVKTEYAEQLSAHISLQADSVGGRALSFLRRLLRR